MNNKIYKKGYENLDTRLLEGRQLLEGKVVGCLWTNPDFFNDYTDLKKDSFITSDGRYYYSLGKKVANKGYEVLDEITILSYIEENIMLKDKFLDRGGYTNIKEVMMSINNKNIDSYIDDLLKSNIIIGLCKEGFNVFDEVEITEGDKSKTVVPYEMFKSMTSLQVSEWYDWRLQSITMDKTMGSTKIVDLDIDDDFIKRCNEGQMMGLPYDYIGEDITGKKIQGCRILNGSTLGIHRGYTELIGGFSGCGKSSFILAERIMPIIYQGEKVALMANEMDEDSYKSILLPMVLAYHFNYYKLTRQNLKKGNFNDEQNQMIQKARDYYREHYLGKLKFVDIDNYNMDIVKTTVRKLSREGVNYYIYDTFKAGNMELNNARGQMIESSKTLHQLAKKYKVGITIVMQLAIYMENVRYVTAGCLSEAKGVKEIVTQMILFRKLWDDEYTGEKYDVKPYRLIWDKETGKFTDSKEFIQLDPNKKYRVMFLDKTRNDDDGKCVLYCFEGRYNRWIEIGLCTPSHIDARGK